MTHFSDIDKIRARFQHARAQINQQKADLALETLRQIKSEIDTYTGTQEWAEFPLLAGEAYCAKCDEAAASHLAEAKERLEKLINPAPELQFRLWEHLGDFEVRVAHRPSRGREYYAQAKTAAVQLGVQEYIARVELKIIRIDLHTDRNREQENFKTLCRVAKDGGFTSEHKLAAWHFHLGRSDDSTKGIRYARGFSNATDEYFCDLLRSVKSSQN